MTTSLGILGALEREIGPIRKGFFLKKIHHQGRITIFQGSYHDCELVLVRTGVGPLNAHEGATITARSFSLTAMISIGYACALRSDLKIGDLVIGERVYIYKGELPCQSDTDLVKRAVEVGDRIPAPCLRGAVVSIARVVSRKEEKKAVASEVPAIALDMESGAVAQAAAQAGLPFLSVRAISDTVDEDLGTDCDRWFSADGTFLLGRGIGYCLTHPSTLVRLNQLRIQTASASSTLCLFIHRFVASFTHDP